MNLQLFPHKILLITIYLLFDILDRQSFNKNIIINQKLLAIFQIFSQKNLILILIDK